MTTENQYIDLFEAKNELHKLLRRVVVSTKLGRQNKDPDDDIELEIGGGIIGSCARYRQVRYYPDGVDREYELDDDIKMIKYLISEVKNRFENFKKARNSNKTEYTKRKKKFTKRFFNPPLKELSKVR
ncbi:MAG: hypothetical protein Q8O89_02640 [Nanoarchaeota archaeon]|nr:hypothetical protein [Nanoarchaeota archaeon]